MSEKAWGPLIQLHVLGPARLKSENTESPICVEHGAFFRRAVGTFGLSSNAQMLLTVCCTSASIKSVCVQSQSLQLACLLHGSPYILQLSAIKASVDREQKQRKYKAPVAPSTSVMSQSDAT